MLTEYHINCGGTILIGGGSEDRHQYCDRCGAFTYDTTAVIPTGHNEKENQIAWDTGDFESLEDTKFLESQKREWHIPLLDK